MGYVIRLFSTSPLSTLIPLQAQMIQRGFQAQPVGTNQLDIFYEPQSNPLVVDLTDSTDAKTKQDLTDYLDAITQLSPSDAQGHILTVLSGTQALVLIGVPDDYDDSSGTLNHIIEIISESADGVFHVEGDGFYEGDTFLLEFK